MLTRPTRWPLLVALCGLSGTLAWAMLRATWWRTGQIPLTPWTAPLSLAVMAVVVLVLARNLKRRLSTDPKESVKARPVHPLGAVRLLAIAKTASYAGSVLTGIYAAFALVIFSETDGPFGSRLVVPLLSALAAIAVVVAGLILERTCRVKPPDNGVDDSLPSSA